MGNPHADGSAYAREGMRRRTTVRQACGVPVPTMLELSDPRWADFVGRHPQATPFHHPCWARLVADCYGFRAFVVAVSDPAGVVRAGLPLVEVRHLHGGRKWVSLPYTDYCPPLACARSEEKELAVALGQASDAAGVRRVQVRAPLAGAASADVALRHVLPLDGGPAEVFAGFHRSLVQRNIRRAEREGLTMRQATTEQDLVGTFYHLHVRSRRRQGVPVQPRRFFRLLWERAISTGLGSVLIVEASGQPVAAAVFLAWNQTMIYKFGASQARAWSLRPNHLLFWHAIRTACEEGYRWFDFGRTDVGHKGLRNFKLSWGAAEEPLVYGTLGGRPGLAPPADGTASRLLGSAIRHGPLLLCRVAGEALYRYAA